VTILGSNTPEHFMTIMGTMCNNCIFSDLYMTNSPSACLEQIDHQQSKIIICDTWAVFKEKFLINQEKLLALGIKTAVLFSEFGNLVRGNASYKGTDGKIKQNRIKVYNWTQFL